MTTNEEPSEQVNDPEKGTREYYLNQEPEHNTGAVLGSRLLECQDQPARRLASGEEPEPTYPREMPEDEKERLWRTGSRD